MTPEQLAERLEAVCKEISDLSFEIITMKKAWFRENMGITEFSDELMYAIVEGL